MEMPFANYSRSINRLRPKHVGHNVVRVKAEKQVRIDGETEALFWLSFVNAGKLIWAPSPRKAHSCRSIAKSHGPANVGGLWRVIHSTQVISNSVKSGV